MDERAYLETQDYLYGLRNRGAKFGIERMERFVEALGHPERSYPIIHVAGTNGKGSTCVMLETIFRKAGYRTGLFTSPHLVFLGERIQCNRHNLSPDQIVHYCDILRPVAEQLAEVDAMDHPTFFEFLTAMAFLHFKEEAVDVAILETGLGGRLDSTNVVEPIISAITSIALDHTEQLGDTLEAIAFEKGGIIKPGRPVVLGHIEAGPRAVLEKIAEERGCKLQYVDAVFTEDVASDLAPYPEPALKGRFQLYNAGLAELVCRILEPEFPNLQDTHSRQKALEDVHWPGRWQSLDSDNGRHLVLDATHNAEGARMLDENLSQLKAGLEGRLLIVVGVLGRVRAQQILSVIKRYADEIIFVTPNQPRACSADELAAELGASDSIQISRGKVGVLFPEKGQCVLGQAGDTVLVTGSLYLIGEVYQQLFYASPSESFLQDKF